MLFLGVHVKKENHKTIYDALVNYFNKYPEVNTAQIFLGSPQGGSVVKLDSVEQNKIKTFIDKNDLLLFSHAKYVINIGSPKAYSYHTLHEELEEIYKLSGIGTVVHCPKSTSIGIDNAYKNSIDAIRKVIHKTFLRGGALQDKNKQKYLKIIIETAAGQGSEMFVRIDDMARFYNEFTPKEKKYIRFCIDTAHIFASGYDISSIEGAKKYIDEFDKKIGIKNVLLIHLNDSASVLGSCVDRHEVIGKGYITKQGMSGMKYIIGIAKKNNIPMILERNSNLKNYNEKSELDLVIKLSREH